MTDLSTPQPAKPDNVAPFTTMASKIDANKDAGFAGAFVICPPGCPPIAALILDDAADAALFLATVKTKIEMAMQDLADKEQQQAGMYGRR